MRMPRMQVYLPEDLYRAVKDRGLPASELLQRAVQAELSRQGLLEETDRYLQDLVAEVGVPSADAMGKADALSRRARRARADRRAS
jgi:post-segregation antitoxin (ccd killing protein)